MDIVNYIREYGGSTSDAVLDPVNSRFLSKKGEGIIGYKMVAHCAIVFGDPVCQEENSPSLAREFHDFCALQKKTSDICICI